MMAVVIDGLTYLTVECPQLCDGQSCRVRVDLYSLSGIIFWRIKNVHVCQNSTDYGSVTIFQGPNLQKN